MQLRFLKAILVLAVVLSVFVAISPAQITIPRNGMTPKSAVQQDVPGEFKAAISQMLGAKSSLEKAGDRWGGHRVKAIHSIDEALREIGQPQSGGRTEMKSGSTDEPAALESGITQLNAAKSDFERSGNQWGGRRAKAITLIDQALRDLQQGIEYAKAHKTY
jgi:hypothetical protein